MTPAASRLSRAFAASQGRTGLIPYLTAGYPSLDASLEMLMALGQAGAHAIEIGIPFSDPIADGPDIQRSSEAALRNGVGAAETLALVAKLRAVSEIPLVVMTYANPILRSGATAFAREARAAGVDGLIVSDLPPDESPEVWQAFDEHGLDTVVLVAPTTDASRLPLLLRRARGFVYCLARTGVTGRGEGYSGALPERIAELRRHTELPVAVGFGIADAAQARTLRGVADAVIVGAAFMRAVAEDPARGVVDRVRSLGRSMIEALS